MKSNIKSVYWVIFFSCLVFTNLHKIKLATFSDQTYNLDNQIKLLISKNYTLDHNTVLINRNFCNFKKLINSIDKTIEDQKANHQNYNKSYSDNKNSSNENKSNPNNNQSLNGTINITSNTPELNITKNQDKYYDADFDSFRMQNKRKYNQTFYKFNRHETKEKKNSNFKKEIHDKYDLLNISSSEIFNNSQIILIPLNNQSVKIKDEICNRCLDISNTLDTIKNNIRSIKLIINNLKELKGDESINMLLLQAINSVNLLKSDLYTTKVILKAVQKVGCKINLSENTKKYKQMEDFVGKLTELIQQTIRSLNIKINLVILT